jgi:hypothetical protein
MEQRTGHYGACGKAPSAHRPEISVPKGPGVPRDDELQLPLRAGGLFRVPFRDVHGNRQVAAVTSDHYLIGQAAAEERSKLVR